MFNRRGLLAFFFASALLIFGLDQWSKLVVVESMELGDRIQVFEFFAWVRWHNYGAAFSLLADAGGWQRWFFVIVAVIFCVYLVLELSRLALQAGYATYPTTQGVAFSCILGGALGNLYDRILDGYVVDFVLVHYREHYFPAFNIADSSLTAGILIWLVVIVQEYRRQPKKRN